tara:strand:+ start:142 stop:1419 length:1278 start_codon:yes stop_codon:yes gene_type:complete
MSIFTFIFLFILICVVSTRIWLAIRHIRFINIHRDTVPENFASQINLDSHQKAADYTCTKTRLSYANIFLDTALLLILTFGGGLNALNSFWSGFFSNSLLHGVVFILCTVLLIGVLEIPINYYRTFVIEKKFGFNKMTPAMFFTDLIKQGSLGILIGLPLLFAILWLMEKAGDNWWLYAWLMWVAFNIILLSVYPTWIAPLFNKFTPLEDSSLKIRIEQLMQKCGFRSSGLFVMDGSRRSSHGNAYFTGFGKNKRIVFFDTLLSHLNPPEIEAVLAHELGHFKKNHVIKRIIWTFTMSLIFLWLLGYLMNQEWFYQGLGIISLNETQTNTFYPSTAMALLLFFLVMPTFTFLFQPLSSFYSRKHEFEADAYAVDKASASDLIQALVKLYQDNAATLTPDPLHSAFYDSHPPALVRIARLQNLAHN